MLCIVFFLSLSSYVVYSRTCTRIHKETTLEARANGAVSGGNRATSGASGRCRNATTDSSESGATVRANGARSAAVQLLFYRARAAKSATLRDNVFLCTRTVCFLRIIQWFVEEHRLRERANGATSGANGADESERSDGPNERSVRNDGWMERMERVAPPFRYVLSNSCCRRARAP